MIPVTELTAAVRDADVILYTATASLERLDTLSEADFTGPGDRLSKLVIEANYKAPAFTGALRARLDGAGAQYVSGRRWLLYQAVTGYAAFTGEQPDFGAMLELLNTL